MQDLVNGPLPVFSTEGRLVCIWEAERGTIFSNDVTCTVNFAWHRVKETVNLCLRETSTT